MSASTLLFSLQDGVAVVTINRPDSRNSINSAVREGLFAAQAKRPLPGFPRVIGVITSPAAAALRDVLTTLERRNPAIAVVVYPVPVQGEGAAARIAAMLATANARDECDVLLLVRGGGSIEDLWSFNEEQVARALRASRIPVVVGVGHESDFTIADFAADRRAPTPTAAAELVSASRAELLGRLADCARGVVREMRRRLNGIDCVRIWLKRLDRHLWKLRRKTHSSPSLYVCG